MNKRLTSVALILCLLLTLLSGCSRDTGTEESIYWLSSHPEAESALLEIAEAYESVSGVSVKIKCVSPDEYETVLRDELYSDEPPVIFECSELEELIGYRDRCYDFSDSAMADTLSSSEDALIYNDRMLALPLGTEYSGLLFNRTLLNKAGFDEVSIIDLAFLRSAAEVIHENADELGFDAFAPASLSSDTAPGFAESLANIALYYEPMDQADWAEIPAAVSGSCLEQLKDFWDMYISLSSCDTEHIADGTISPLDAFAKGEAVFCIGSSSDAAVLATEYGMSADDIGIIPLYLGVNDKQQGLCEKCSGYFAINVPAVISNVDLALDFVQWLTGSEQGLSLMRQAFGQLSYKNAPDSDDSFAELARSLNSQGKLSVDWVYRFTPNAADWYAVFAHALGKYSQGEDFERVRSAFVDGWLVQYAATQTAD